MSVKDKFWKENYMTLAGYAIESPARQAPDEWVGVYKLVKVVKGRTILSEFDKMGMKMLAEVKK